MTIGVISDTHGNIEFLTDVINFMISNFKVDKIYHLGDNFKDGEELKRFNINYKIVPGIYDPEYMLEEIPKIIIEKISGFNILLTHSLDEINFSNKDVCKCRIICYGHTHNWKLELNDGVLFLNPGHLKSRFHKDRIATFAILTIEQFFITVKIYDIDKNLLKEEKFLCA